MNKTMLNLLESKLSISRRGNHGVHIWNEPHESHIVNDFTGQTVSFMATRDFLYMGSVVCVVNDKNKTFQLSHAGVWAHVYEKDTMGNRVDTGVIREGVFPKTTTQRLMSYRDYFVTAGYEEIDPIIGRKARNWREWDEKYQEAKAKGIMLKPANPKHTKSHVVGGTIVRATKHKARKVKGVSKEMQSLLESKGIDVMAMLEAEQLKNDMEDILFYEKFKDEYDRHHAPVSELARNIKGQMEKPEDKSELMARLISDLKKIEKNKIKENIANAQKVA